MSSLRSGRLHNSLRSNRIRRWSSAPFALWSIPSRAQ